MNSIHKAINILQTARSKGVQILLDGEQLQLKYSKDNGIDANLVEDIKINKDLIISFLKDNESKTDNNSVLETEIKKADLDPSKGIPLSFSQERLWFIDRLDSSIQYHIPDVLRLKGKLNTEALAFSLQNIIERHEVLRTVFIEEDGVVLQHIKNFGDWHLDKINGSEFNDSGLKSCIKDLISKPFNLSKDDMLRADLINLAEDENILVVTMHHIASDGWSRSILVKEVLETYRSFDNGEKSSLAPLKIQYSDYAIWQRENLSGDLLKRKLKYWKDKLKDTSQLRLPTDFKRPDIQSTRGAACSFNIGRDLSDKLLEISHKHGATLFMTLLSAFKLMLHRYSGEPDICVGTVVAGRQHPALEGLIGFFVNTLALRSEVNNKMTFTELLHQVKRTTIEAQEHQDVPFEKIVDAVVKERSLSRSPLFQVMFVLQNLPKAEGLILGDLKLTREESVHDTAKFELTLGMTESNNGLAGTFEYCTDLFKEETIERMITHFKELLNSIAEHPERDLGSLSMTTESEKSQLLKEFKDIAEKDFTDKTFIELFEEQVSKTPDNIALVFEDKELTYKEINERSNQLGHYLRSKGVKEETMVPVCMGRSEEQMIGILGILKSGAAYVPVDPEYPEEQINFILQDTGSSIVLCNANSRPKFSAVKKIDIVETEKNRSEISKQPKKNLKHTAESHHLAYVIYTSGSTGKPKGVMIEHSNLACYLLNSKTNYIDSNSGHSGSFIHLPFTFDASITALFMPLLHGKSVVIGSKQSLEVFEDKNFLKYAPYDFIKITPSHLELLQSKIKTVDDGIVTKKLVIGGEALLHSQLNYLTENGIEVNIINEYGPTEATVGCGVYSFNTLSDNGNSKNEIPIGKAIDNVIMYVLGESKEIVPVGVCGEIYIGGSGLARGYLNMTELTKEKFIKDPFNKNKGARLYRTGDMGRHLSDSNFEYLGRIDDQVKIRGYRVELGEIESVLQESGLINQSAVLARDKNEGGRRLVGYVVPVGIFDKEAVITFLKKKLPPYMIPALWVEMESLPISKNGKIDRKALPDPDASSLINNKYEAPRNELEEKLAEIWKELLHVERVGIHDNFFELGGDSIITIQIVNRARRIGYDLNPKDIFINQTIKSLSTELAERSAAEVTGEQGILTGPCGLLPIQQWYLEGDHKVVSHFNQSVLLSIDKSLSSGILEKAVKQVTAHHDALRFRYLKKNGRWQQEYGAFEGRLITVDLKSAPEDSLSNLIKENADKYQKSLDIEKGEIARFVLIQTPERESKNRILIVIHHLAIDGVSWRILLDDLMQLVKDIQKEDKSDLGYKSSSYRQWYEALQEYGKSNRLLSQRTYWEEAERSYEPLHVDKEFSGTLRSSDLDTHVVRLDAEQTRLLLQEVPGAYHTEINDMLLCALALTLCEWQSVEKITIGLEGHGRESISENIDISRTVGWFTSLYPLKLEIKKTNLPDVIKSIKEQLRLVPDKGLGYGVLNYINKDKILSGNDCWDIVFNYLGQLDNAVSGDKGLSGAGESKSADVSEENLVNNKFMINGFVSRGQLILNWSYSNRHYEKETVLDLAKKYQSTLESLISHCTEQLKSGAVYTPTDYGLGSEITYEELDKFLDEPFNESKRRDSISGLYRLSGLQQGMLFHALYDSRAGAYIEQLRCDLTDPDLEIIRKSWDHVISRHSILRSGFYYDEFSVPVQCVYREVEIPVTVLDSRNLKPEERSEAIIKFEEDDRNRKFDFKSAPLMRVGLIRLSKDRYRMLWTSHHILFDGWSLPVIMEEFLSTYDTLISGKTPEIKEEDRYEEFIRYIERQDKDHQEDFWRKYMDGVEQSTLLPFIGISSQRNKGVGVYASEFINLDEETTAGIEQYAQKNRVTVNTIMQGVWSYLLHRYTGSNNIVYGVTVSGRPEGLPGIERRVGMYINTLPLHSAMRSDQETDQWLQNLQMEHASSRQYQYTPLQDIQRITGVSGDLFDSLLVFENYPVGEITRSKQWKLKVENVQMKEQTNFPLTISIVNARETNINFSYNSGILKLEYVQGIRDHFDNVLKQITRNEKIRLGEIEILTESEKSRLLFEFNDTELDFPKDKTVIDLFEEQVTKTPDNLAVVFKEHQLTYKELNDRSNQLAHYLQSNGVKKETLVPIFIERSPEMIIGILGILKAGGAYLPIDPEYPEERIEFMLKDSGALVILSSNDIRSRLPVIENIEVIEINSDLSKISGHPLGNLESRVEPGDLAYVIYTSGSTGQPKGVMNEHGGLINRLQWAQDYFKLTKDDSILQKTTYCFDVSVWELLLPLIAGSKLVFAEPEGHKDTRYLKSIIENEQITMIHFVPSMLELFLTELERGGCKDLRKVICSGEALKPFQVELFKNKMPDTELHNLYGPTEAAIDVTYWRVPEEAEEIELIPIGKPVANTSIYILDENYEPVPIGCIGQIYIGGIQVARGYLNRSDLTKENFVKNPFNKKPGSRMYKTGDLGRWLGDGNIEYLGRRDDQVKIRGFRIELGEIESILQESGMVLQSVVLAREDAQKNNRLVGYVVAGDIFEKEKLISYLQDRLPEYMVPYLWVELDSLPLTQNGKINRKALPDPESSDMISNEYKAPRNELEEKLAAIWKELLKVERVGIYDNFFELGGHSLLAMRVISAISKELEIELEIKDLFKFTSINDLSKYLEIQTNIYADEKDSEEYEKFLI